LEDRILYLPWSRNDDGFQATDPQVAWDRCPDPAHLLWVIYHAQRTAYGNTLADDVFNTAQADIVRWSEAFPKECSREPT